MFFLNHGRVVNKAKERDKYKSVYLQNLHPWPRNVVSAVCTRPSLLEKKPIVRIKPHLYTYTYIFTYKRIGENKRKVISYHFSQYMFNYEC
jgi:hypothetical protein